MEDQDLEFGQVGLHEGGLGEGLILLDDVMEGGGAGGGVMRDLNGLESPPERKFIDDEDEDGEE